MYHLCLHGWDEHPCIGRRVCHTGPAASSCLLAGPEGLEPSYPGLEPDVLAAKRRTRCSRGAAVQCVSRPCGSPRSATTCAAAFRRCMGADGSPEIPRSPIERAMSPRRSMTRGRKTTPPEGSPARYSRTSAEWPCIFKTELAKTRLDPAIKKLWESRRSDRPKWGDLRTTFRREHCRNLNPWGSETCPFKETDCALAFYAAVEQSLHATNPYGYFRSVCRSTGALRADLGVELRSRMRTDANEGRVGRPTTASLREGPADGLRPSAAEGPDELVVRDVDGGDAVDSVRRVATGLPTVGDVLRDIGVRPRPRSGPDGDPDEGRGR